MLRTLDGAIEAFEQALARHPERDGLAAEESALGGLPRRCVRYSARIMPQVVRSAQATLPFEGIYGTYQLRAARQGREGNDGSRSPHSRPRLAGGPSWIRTSDQGIMSPLLYR